MEINIHGPQHAVGGPPSVFLSFWENGGPDSYRNNRSVTVRLLSDQGDNANGLRLSYTKATEYRIDEAHANPLASWVAMGSPVDLSQAQVKQLMAASAVKPATLDLVSNAITVVLPPNSASVIVFS